MSATCLSVLTSLEVMRISLILSKLCTNGFFSQFPLLSMSVVLVEQSVELPLDVPGELKHVLQFIEYDPL